MTRSFTCPVTCRYKTLKQSKSRSDVNKESGARVQLGSSEPSAAIPQRFSHRVQLVRTPTQGPQIIQIILNQMGPSEGKSCLRPPEPWVGELVYSDHGGMEGTGCACKAESSHNSQFSLCSFLFIASFPVPSPSSSFMFHHSLHRGSD